MFLDPNCRGKGICVEMVHKLLEIGFNELGLRRIDLRFYGFNTAAIGCYERAGLVRCIFKQDKVQYKIAQEWLSTWLEKNVP